MPTIFTVHGTFASGPDHGMLWWQKGSPFEKHIRQMVEADGGELHYEPVIWRDAPGSIMLPIERLEASVPVADASAIGAKAVVGHHGHHGLAQHIAQKAAEKAADASIRAVLSKRRKKDESPN